MDGVRDLATRSAVAVAAQPLVAEGLWRPAPRALDGNEPPPDASAARDARSLLRLWHRDLGHGAHDSTRVRCDRTRHAHDVAGTHGGPDDMVDVRRGEEIRCGCGAGDRRAAGSACLAALPLVAEAARGVRPGAIRRRNALPQDRGTAEHRRCDGARHDRRRIAESAGAVVVAVLLLERVLMAVDELVVGLSVRRSERGRTEVARAQVRDLPVV